MTAMGATSPGKTKSWHNWARDWGLTHRPQRGWFGHNEQVAGAARGYLIRAGWSTVGSAEYLQIVIRFSKHQNPAELQEKLLAEERLRALPGWKRKRSASLVVTASSLLWQRQVGLGAPSAEKVRGWVELWLDVLPAHVRAFEDRCEQCNGPATSYLLVDDLPVRLCGTCQGQIASSGEAAERQYAQLDANYMGGVLLGAAGAAAGGVGWAVLAIVTHRIYAAVAIGIAVLTAWLYTKGAGKVDRLGQVIGAALTMAGVVLGDVIFYAYMVHVQYPQVPFRLDVGWAVYVKGFQEAPGDVLPSLFFGLFGVWTAFQALKRPALKKKIQRPGEESSRQSSV